MPGHASTRCRWHRNRPVYAALRDSVAQVAYFAYLAGLDVNLNGFSALVEIHANARRAAVAIFKPPFAVGAQLVHPAYRIAHHNQLVVDPRRAPAAVDQPGAGNNSSQNKHQVTHVTPSSPCLSIGPESTPAGKSGPRKPLNRRHKTMW